MDDSSKEPYKDRTWLYEQYIEDERPAREIADECGVTQRTIRNWIAKFGYDTKARIDPPEKDEAWLREHYHEKEMTLEEIGDKASVSGQTIYNWMEEFGIERHSPGSNPE